MRVYCVTHDDSDLGRLLHWETSKREAEKVASGIREEYRDKAREMKAEHPGATPHRPDVEVHAVNIPTKKIALVGWLNLNLKTDNG
jgi:hypothetical protein